MTLRETNLLGIALREAQEVTRPVVPNDWGTAKFGIAAPEKAIGYSPDQPL